LFEGLDPEEITRLCDLHIQLFQDGLEKQAGAETGAQHPLTVLRAENLQIAKAAAEFRNTVDLLRTPEASANLVSKKDEITSRLEALAKVEAHCQRKENQLFPFLEKHRITAHPQVMWSTHDETRRLIKDTRAALDSQHNASLVDSGERLVQKVEDMIYNEEKILFPMAMEVLTKEDWERMSGAEAETRTPRTPEGVLSLDTGELNGEQLNLILTHLPVMSRSSTKTMLSATTRRGRSASSPAHPKSWATRCRTAIHRRVYMSSIASSGSSRLGDETWPSPGSISKERTCTYATSRFVTGSNDMSELSRKRKTSHQ